MPPPLILASGSAVRATLLRNAGLAIEVVPARIDEAMLRAGLEADAAKPRDVADILADAKARKVAARHPDALVLGCDQVLAHDGGILGKPESPEDARAQLRRLRNTRHELYAAAVVYEADRPLWRHVGTARLTMRSFSDGFLDAYIARNWDSVRESVGAYKLEAEGVQLFSRIEGDYFTILGLPLLELLGYLRQRGSLEL